jgi:methionyl aminopeptidase
MINAGVNDLIELVDGWTTITADKKPSAHFEHTIAMTKDGPVRLTGPPNDEELKSLPEWLHDKSQWLLW